MFQVFIDQKVLEYVEGLPFHVQVKCYMNLDTLLCNGLTNLCSGDVSILAFNKFKIKVHVNDRGAALNTGLILHGYYKKTENGKAEYYLTEAVAYIDQKVISAPWEIDNYHFIEVDQKFLEERKHETHLNEARDNLPPRSKYHLFHRAEKNHFHKSLIDIKKFKSHHEEFGSKLSFNAAYAKTDEYIYLEEGQIKPVIERLKRKYKQPYIIVNFIDEQDDFYHAQLELIRLASYGLKHTYETPNILIIDVCIRNKEGKEFFEEEYQKYFKQAPKAWGEKRTAFSLLMFRPYWRDKNTKYRKFKTLYLNLFEGCRDEALSPETDKKFLINRDLIIHEMHASMACCASMHIVDVKDMRGENEEKVQHVIKILSKDAVVLRVNGKSNYAERLISLCKVDQGYPFIIVVEADGNENLVTVNMQSPSGEVISSEFLVFERDDIINKIESIYELGILAHLPGNQSIESLYSNNTLSISMMVKRFLQSHNYTPSIVSESKKQPSPTA